MAKNWLKLGSDRTEFLINGTRQQLVKMQYNVNTYVSKTYLQVDAFGILEVNWINSEIKITNHVQHGNYITLQIYHS